MQPSARTRKTRAYFGKQGRDNKADDLSLAQNIVINARFDVPSISQYASTYMARNQAGMGVGTQARSVGEVQSVPDLDTLSKLSVSDESHGAKKTSRLFGQDDIILDADAGNAQLDRFRSAQKKGHTPIIEVLSFSKEELVALGVLDPKDVQTSGKGLLGAKIDQGKFRVGLQSAFNQSLKQAGFEKGEWMAAIHGNTENIHVHLAMIETDDFALERLVFKDKKDLEPDKDGYNSDLLFEQDKAFKDWLSFEEDQDLAVKDQGVVRNQRSFIDDMNLVNKVPGLRAKMIENPDIVVLERGMMRQSEMDFMRQNIVSEFKSLDKLKHLDKFEELQLSQKQLSQKLQLQLANQEIMVSGLLDLYMNLPYQKEKWSFKEGTVAGDYLEKSARQLIGSDTDFGQKDYLKKAHVMITDKLDRDPKLLSQYIQTVTEPVDLKDLLDIDYTYLSLGQKYGVMRQLEDQGYDRSDLVENFQHFVDLSIDEQVTLQHWLNLDLPTDAKILGFELPDNLKEMSRQVYQGQSLNSGQKQSIKHYVDFKGVDPKSLKPLEKDVYDDLKQEQYSREMINAKGYLTLAVKNSLVKQLENVREAGLSSVEFLNVYGNVLRSESVSKVSDDIKAYQQDLDTNHLPESFVVNGQFVNTSKEAEIRQKRFNKLLNHEEKAIGVQSGLSQETIMNMALRYAPDQKIDLAKPSRWQSMYYANRDDQASWGKLGKFKQHEVWSALDIMNQAKQDELQVYSSHLDQIIDSEKRLAVQYHLSHGVLPNRKMRDDLTKDLPIAEVGPVLGEVLKNNIDRYGQPEKLLSDPKGKDVMVNYMATLNQQYEAVDTLKAVTMASLADQGVVDEENQITQKGYGPEYATDQAVLDVLEDEQLTLAQHMKFMQGINEIESRYPDEEQKKTAYADLAYYNLSQDAKTDLKEEVQADFLENKLLNSSWGKKFQATKLGQTLVKEFYLGEKQASDDDVRKYMAKQDKVSLQTKVVEQELKSLNKKLDQSDKALKNLVGREVENYPGRDIRTVRSQMVDRVADDSWVMTWLSQKDLLNEYDEKTGKAADQKAKSDPKSVENDQVSVEYSDKAKDYVVSVNGRLADMYYLDDQVQVNEASDLDMALGRGEIEMVNQQLPESPAPKKPVVKAQTLAEPETMIMPEEDLKQESEIWEQVNQQMLQDEVKRSELFTKKMLQDEVMPLAPVISKQDLDNLEKGRQQAKIMSQKPSKPTPVHQPTKPAKAPEKPKKRSERVKTNQPEKDWDLGR